MPRKPASTPSLHKASGQYYFYQKRKMVYLGRDYDAALKEMRTKLLAEAYELPAPVPVEQMDGMPVRILFALYIEHIAGRRNPVTVEGYRLRLVRVTKLVNCSIPCSAFRKTHLATIESKMKDYSPTTVKDTLSTVMGVFRWASENDMLEGNRLAGYKLPAPNQRQRIITDEEFSSLLKAAVGNLSLRHVMVACRSTGCRPGELRAVTWDQIRDGAMVLPKHKTRTMQKEPRPRVIPIPPSLARRLEWMKQRSQSPYAFTNEHGKPYTKDALVRAFARCRTRAKIEVKDGENLVLYSHRHTFITNSVGRATDLELSEVTGHTNTRMLKRYTHMDIERIKAIREKLG